jgi:dynein regulatory complex protein 1
MRLDSIFKALGVETVEDIERLTSYFVNDDTISETDRDKSKSQLIAEDNAQLIKPEEVVIAIRKFTEENRKGIDLNGMEITTVGDIDDGISSQPIESKSKSQLQKEYWERMANVIDDKSYRTWTVS